VIKIFYLTEKQHEVVELSQFNNKSISEIRTITELSLSCIISRFSQVLHKIRAAGIPLKSILDLRGMCFKITRIESREIQYKYELIQSEGETK